MKISFFLLPITLTLFVAQSCTVKRTKILESKSVVNHAAIKINLQERKDFKFENEGVFFSNNFPAARVNDLEKVNDSTFNIRIESENGPINPSPWFAFKVWGRPDKNVYLNLNYPTAKHRYTPKSSNDGITWKNLNNVDVNADKNRASFKIQLGTDTLTIAAQEIIASKDSYNWMNQVAKNYSLHTEVIGRSIGGKPIIALNSTQSDGKKIVVVLSRQHPPEVSGYLAMTTFVETLLGESPLAKDFLKNYELVVIPMINPDGVDEGNWRHSLAGVDLNRDWTDFRQPETRAIRDYLLSKLKNQNAKVYFALDFHSTYNDILYINEDSAETNHPGLVRSWIAGLHRLEEVEKTAVKPSGNGGDVSKAWLGRVLGAEALTYEVGDNTPRPYLAQKAEKVAVVLMELLKKK